MRTEGAKTVREALHPSQKQGMGSESFGPPFCKVCGLTRAEDVALCHRLGVAFTGFIFVPGSPRRLSPEQAAALPLGRARRVGVFAGASLEEIAYATRVARLDFVQLHGGEDEDFCRAVGPERVIKTLWPEVFMEQSPGNPGVQGRRPAKGEAADSRICPPEGAPLCPEKETAAKSIPTPPAGLLREFERYAPVCSYLLLDAGKSGGGSGKKMDLSSFAALQPPRPWLLAGGIGPENIESALAACSPQGLDMNSTLESAPGIKDPARLEAAMRILGAWAKQ